MMRFYYPFSLYTGLFSLFYTNPALNMSLKLAFFGKLFKAYIGINLCFGMANIVSYNSTNIQYNSDKIQMSILISICGYGVFFLMFKTEETKDDFNSTILKSNDSCASYRDLN